MKRRAFIAGLAGAAAWPLVANAQQSAVPVVALLRSTSLENVPHLVTGLREGPKRSGLDRRERCPGRTRVCRQLGDHAGVDAGDLHRTPQVFDSSHFGLRAERGSARRLRNGALRPTRAGLWDNLSRIFLLSLLANAYPFGDACGALKEGQLAPVKIF